MARNSHASIISALVAPIAIFCAMLMAQNPAPIRWSMSVTPAAGPVKKGSTLTAHIKAMIAPGWHLYAMEQKPRGPRAMRIVIPVRQSYMLTGVIQGERPKVSFDPTFNIETRSYENNVNFRIPLTISSDVFAGKTEVRADVTYQACNDRLCLPPTVAHLSAAVRIAPERPKSGAAAPRP